MLFVNTCKRVAAGSHLLVLLFFFSQAHMKAFLVSTLCLFCLFFFPCSLFLLSVVSYLSLCLISFVISILICIILYYLPFFLFCGIYSSCFSSLVLSFVILYLFLIPLLLFVPSYSHRLSLSVTFCILNLSLFLRYLLVFFFLVFLSLVPSQCVILLRCRPWAGLPSSTARRHAGHCCGQVSPSCRNCIFRAVIIVPRNFARKGSLEDLQLNGRKM
jgi:hypothetical protein